MGAPIVRPALVADADAIAAVHTISSDEAYAPLAAHWRPADIGRRAALWAKSIADLDAGSIILVAEDARAIVGLLAAGAPRRVEPAIDRELHVIHVLPEHRGRGVGDALWTAGCNELRGPDLAAFYLDTLAELRCCAFYERHGGEVIEHRPTTFFGAARTHVTYRWPRGAPHAR